MNMAALFGGLWRDREFRTFWSAQTVPEFGDRITELALPLIAVTMLDATPAEVGFLTAAVWLPNVVSLFIGTWVDQQRDKKALLIAADLVLASGTHWATLLAGVALWGVHMGMTQGLLATMVADTAPADLRGTAFGFFNLVSGGALLLASGLAGLLWDRLGAEFTFYAGAVFSALALGGLLLQRGPVSRIS